jgi:hypothetical protein
MPLRRGAIALLIAAASAAPAVAQRTPASFEIAVETPATIEGTLRRLSRQGYSCGAVARPSGPVLSESIAVLLTRPAAASSAPPAGRDADILVVTASAGAVEDLESALNAAAVQGYRPCGLTLTAPIWGRTAAYAAVAVLARTSVEPTGIAYRVVRSRARREDWARLVRAAADGFVVSRLVSLPGAFNAGDANTSEIVFVAERTTAATPTRYELAFAGNGPALEKEIAKAVATGHCALTAWATAERMSVLLARPIDGPCTGAHDYEIEESGRFTVNAADGRLLALFRVKDGTMALHDGAERATEYSTVEGVLTDDGRGHLAARDRRLLIEKLDADGERGYLPFDVQWRDAGTRGQRAVDVILSRPRP